MLPATTERVPLNTSEEHNERIRQRTEHSVSHHGHAGTPSIERRLADLEHEWDMERTLEANAATVSLIGSALGAFVDRRFFAVPVVVAGFLLQHALQGWCPPVPLFRRLGFRTQREIDEERFALKTMRGDFREVTPGTVGHDADARRALDAVRR